MVMDYKRLNKQTVKNNYPLLLITDLVDNMGNKKLFFKIDCYEVALSQIIYNSRLFNFSFVFFLLVNFTYSKLYDLKEIHKILPLVQIDTNMLNIQIQQEL